MIYTKMTCDAARIAYAAHKGQYDACGMPYIMHPLHVAEKMSSEVATAAALLHDVVEDTDITLDDLRAQGISEEVVCVVDLLTHRPGVPYDEYIAKIKTNDIAVAVKLADLAHNMDKSRYNGSTRVIDQETIERRFKKYLAAFHRLVMDEK